LKDPGIWKGYHPQAGLWYYWANHSTRTCIDWRGINQPVSREYYWFRI